jgi:hypothetical protein
MATSFYEDTGFEDLLKQISARPYSRPTMTPQAPTAPMTPQGLDIETDPLVAYARRPEEQPIQLPGAPTKRMGFVSGLAHDLWTGVKSGVFSEAKAVDDLINVIVSRLDNSAIPEGQRVYAAEEAVSALLNAPTEEDMRKGLLSMTARGLGSALPIVAEFLVGTKGLVTAATKVGVPTAIRVGGRAGGRLLGQEAAKALGKQGVRTFGLGAPAYFGLREGGGSLAEQMAEGRTFGEALPGAAARGAKGVALGTTLGVSHWLPTPLRPAVVGGAFAGGTALEPEATKEDILSSFFVGGLLTAPEMAGGAGRAVKRWRAPHEGRAPAKIEVVNNRGEKLSVDPAVIEGYRSVLRNRGVQNVDKLTFATLQDLMASTSAGEAKKQASIVETKEDALKSEAIQDQNAKVDEKTRQQGQALGKTVADYEQNFEKGLAQLESMANMKILKTDSQGRVVITPERFLDVCRVNGLPDIDAENQNVYVSFTEHILNKSGKKFTFVGQGEKALGKELDIDKYGVGSEDVKVEFDEKGEVKSVTMKEETVVPEAKKPEAKGAPRPLFDNDGNAIAYEEARPEVKAEGKERIVSKGRPQFPTEEADMFGVEAATPKDRVSQIKAVRKEIERISKLKSRLVTEQEKVQAIKARAEKIADQTRKEPIINRAKAARAKALKTAGELQQAREKLLAYVGQRGTTIPKDWVNEKTGHYDERLLQEVENKIAAERVKSRTQAQLAGKMKKKAEKAAAEKVEKAEEAVVSEEEIAYAKDLIMDAVTSTKARFDKIIGALARVAKTDAIKAAELQKEADGLAKMLAGMQEDIDFINQNGRLPEKMRGGMFFTETLGQLEREMSAYQDYSEVMERSQRAVEQPRPAEEVRPEILKVTEADLDAAGITDPDVRAAMLTKAGQKGGPPPKPGKKIPKVEELMAPKKRLPYVIAPAAYTEQMRNIGFRLTNYNKDSGVAIYTEATGYSQRVFEQKLKTPEGQKWRKVYVNLKTGAWEIKHIASNTTLLTSEMSTTTAAELPKALRLYDRKPTEADIATTTVKGEVRWPKEGIPYTEKQAQRLADRLRQQRKSVRIEKVAFPKTDPKEKTQYGYYVIETKTGTMGEVALDKIFAPEKGQEVSVEVVSESGDKIVLQCSLKDAANLAKIMGGNIVKGPEEVIAKRAEEPVKSRLEQQQLLEEDAKARVDKYIEEKKDLKVKVAGMRRAGMLNDRILRIIQKWEPEIPEAAIPGEPLPKVGPKKVVEPKGEAKAPRAVPEKGEFEKRPQPREVDENLEYIEMRKEKRIDQITSLIKEDMPKDVLVKELSKKGVLFWEPPETEIDLIADYILSRKLAITKGPGEAPGGPPPGTRERPDVSRFKSTREFLDELKRIREEREATTSAEEDLAVVGEPTNVDVDAFMRELMGKGAVAEDVDALVDRAMGKSSERRQLLKQLDMTMRQMDKRVAALLDEHRSRLLDRPNLKGRAHFSNEARIEELNRELRDAFKEQGESLDSYRAVTRETYGATEGTGVPRHEGDINITDASGNPFKASVFSEGFDNGAKYQVIVGPEGLPQAGQKGHRSIARAWVSKGEVRGKERWTLDAWLARGLPEDAQDALLDLILEKNLEGKGGRAVNPKSGVADEVWERRKDKGYEEAYSNRLRRIIALKDIEERVHGDTELNRQLNEALARETALKKTAKGRPNDPALLEKLLQEKTLIDSIKRMMEIEAERGPVTWTKEQKLQYLDQSLGLNDSIDQSLQDIDYQIAGKGGIKSEDVVRTIDKLGDPSRVKHPTVRRIANYGQQYQLAYRKALMQYSQLLDQGIGYLVKDNPLKNKELMLHLHKQKVTEQIRGEFPDYKNLKDGEAFVSEDPAVVQAAEFHRVVFEDLARRFELDKKGMYVPEYATIRYDLNKIWEHYKEPLWKAEKYTSLPNSILGAINPRHWEDLHSLALKYKDVKWDDIPMEHQTFIKNHYLKWGGAFAEWEFLPRDLQQMINKEQWVEYFQPRTAGGRYKFALTDDYWGTTTRYLTVALRGALYNEFLARVNPLLRTLPHKQSSGTWGKFASDYVERLGGYGNDSFSDIKWNAMANHVNAALAKSVIPLWVPSETVGLYREALYRGALGPDTALRNLTQIMYTWAEDGTMPLLKGLIKFTHGSWTKSPEYLKYREMRDLLEENFYLEMSSLRKSSPGKWQKVKDTNHKITWLVLSPLRFTENLNKGIAYFSGLEAGLKKGVDFRTAHLMGTRNASVFDTTNLERTELEWNAWQKMGKAQFLYGPSTTSPYLQGNLVSSFMPFMSFPIKSAQMFMNGYRESWMAKDWMKLARMMAVSGFMASAPLVLANTLGIDAYAVWGKGALPIDIMPMWYNTMRDLYTASGGGDMDDFMSQELARRRCKEALWMMLLPQYRWFRKTGVPYEVGMTDIKGSWQRIDDKYTRWGRTESPLTETTWWAEFMGVMGWPLSDRREGREWMRESKDFTQEYSYKKSKAIRRIMDLRSEGKYQAANNMAKMAREQGIHIEGQDIAMAERNRRIDAYTLQAKRVPKHARGEWMRRAQEMKLKQLRGGSRSMWSTEREEEE